MDSKGLELEEIFGKDVNLIKIIFPYTGNNYNQSQNGTDGWASENIIKGISTAEFQIGGGNTWNRPALNALDSLNQGYQMFNTILNDFSNLPGDNMVTNTINDVVGFAKKWVDKGRSTFGLGKNLQFRSTTKAIYSTSEIPSFGVNFLLMSYRSDKNILKQIMKLQSAVMPEAPTAGGLGAGARMLNLPLESQILNAKDAPYPFFALRIGNYFYAYKLLFNTFEATLSQQEVEIDGGFKVPLFASCQATFTLYEQVTMQDYKSFFSRGGIT